MQLIDQPGALADDRLQAAGDLAEGALRQGQGCVGVGPFGDGEAGGGLGLDGIGLLGAEEGGAVVLVALGIAARDGQREVAGETVHEVQEVVSVLPRGVQADDERDLAEACGDLLQALAKQGIAGGRFGEGQVGGGRLQVVPKEGGDMAIACGIDADAHTARRLS